jgi:hypothetical protein
MKTHFKDYYKMQYINSYRFAESGIPTDGLVAYYPFNGNANDESGNGYDGTVNGATLTTDRNNNPNSAYSFDGNDQITLLDDFALIDNSTPFTISFWTYLTSYSNTFPTVIKLKTTGTQPYFIWLNTNNAAYRPVFFGSRDTFYTGKMDTDISSDFLNAWYHFVLQFDGVDASLVSSYSLIVNNINRGITNGGTISSQSNTNNIGYGEFSGGFFNGKIDDIRIYNLALTPEEITLLFEK